MTQASDTRSVVVCPQRLSSPQARPASEARIAACLRFLLGIALALLLISVVGCGPSPEQSVSTSSVGPSTLRPHEPIVRNWPADLAGVVADQRGQLVLADARGVVCREVDPPRTVMGRDEQSATFSFALSNNKQYIAYLAARDRLVVRHTTTGEQVGTVAVEPMSEMAVIAVSDDASCAVLVSSAADRGQWHTSMLPQTVTLCNLRDGNTLKSAVLSEYASEAASAIYIGYPYPVVACFLPDNELLLSRCLGSPRVVRYRSENKGLEQIGALDRVWAASATGAVLGAVERWEGPVGRLTPVVWVDGDAKSLTEPLVFEEGGVPGWSGAISLDGCTVAIPVGGDLPRTLFWQALRREDGTWLPVGQIVRTPESWVQVCPCAVTSRGGLIWSLWSNAAPRSEGETRQYPMSVDVASGEWTSWFDDTDLSVEPEDFDVLALITAS